MKNGLLQLKGTKVFKWIWENQDQRIIALEGSSRSSKTFSILQYLITRAITEKLTIKCYRRKATWLKDSVIADFFKCLDICFPFLEGRESPNYNITDKIYRFANGSKFLFVGMDTPQKSHGAEQHIAWFNEAIEGTWESYKQVEQRTLKQLILDWNPSVTQHWIFDKVLNQDICNYNHSTFKDNINFLPHHIINTLSSYEPTAYNIAQGTADERHWKIYGLGIRCALEGVIFPDVRFVREMPAVEHRKFEGYGMDFGFIHPSALIHCCLFDEQIYVDEIIYQEQLTNLHNNQAPRQNSLQKEFERKKVSKKLEITADSAKPDTIQDIHNLGYFIKGVNKFDNSVDFGINTLKRYIINITERSLNIKNEAENYKWAEDKDGKQLDVPVKNFDHAWDAIRYWALRNLAKPQKSFVIDDTPQTRGTYDDY